MEDLKFQYHWEAVEGSRGAAYRFPGAVTRHVTEKYALPAVYRWALFDSEGRLVAVYFGETKNVPSRIRQYLNPGRKQETNIRLKEIFDDELRKGSKIELQCLAFQPFSVCGRPFALQDLSKSYVRRLLENLVLALERHSGPRILNMVVEGGQKPTKEEMRQFREILKNMSAAEKRALFERAGLESQTK